MNINLSQKNAFVCGSSQGIGKAIAISLAKAGANVTLIARNKDRLKEVLSELDSAGGQKHDLIVVDFADSDALKKSVLDYIEQNNKTIHILINNTGGPSGGPITEAGFEEFQKAINMHIVGNHILAQAVLPGMEKVAYGRIINITSTSIKIPIHGLGVSNTTRAAVAGWAKTLSNEVGGKGITVNNVLPGKTFTERLKQIIQYRADQANTDFESMAQIMRDRIPVGRFAEAEEIAAMVCFLASSQASFVNGTSIRVDGGETGSI